MADEVNTSLLTLFAFKHAFMISITPLIAGFITSFCTLIMIQSSFINSFWIIKTYSKFIKFIINNVHKLTMSSCYSKFLGMHEQTNYFLLHLCF